MLRKIIGILFSHNWFAVIYFNFKMLPLRQAIHLPFDFYHSIRFENLSGKINLSRQKPKRAMIKIGGRGSEMVGRTQTILDIKGQLNISGNAEIGHGSLLRIEKSGIMNLGNDVRIGANSKVFCEKRITVGDEVDFSWDCQIFDTNFHYTRDTSTMKISEKTKAISIGSYNWFGNRVTVMKGTITPDYLIVGSNSLCNKNYSNLESNSVIAGIPARLVGEKTQRIFENIEDIKLIRINESL